MEDRRMSVTHRLQIICKAQLIYACREQNINYTTIFLSANSNYIHFNGSDGLIRKQISLAKNNVCSPPSQSHKGW